MQRYQARPSQTYPIVPDRACRSACSAQCAYSGLLTAAPAQETRNARKPISIRVHRNPEV